MSRKPRNNHYHYAEKFEDKRRRMRASDILKAPKKALTLAFLALLAFGLISTTFAAYVSTDEFAENTGIVVVSSRNTLAEREGLAFTGGDSDLASTGWWTGKHYILNNISTSGWDTSSPTSRPEMGDNGDGKYYYIFYVRRSDTGLSTDSYQIRFRLYSGTGSKYLAPDTASLNPGSGGNGNVHDYSSTDNYYYITLNNNGNSIWQKVFVAFDKDGNNGGGWVWGSATDLSAMTASMKLGKTSANGTSAVTIGKGDSVKLKGSCTNLTSYYYDGGDGGKKAKYTYQYKRTDITDSWHDIEKYSKSGSGSTTDDERTWTPSAAGTYSVRVIANDDNLVAGSNCKSYDRYATSSSYTVTVLPKYTVTYSYDLGNGTTTDSVVSGSTPNSTTADNAETAAAYTGYTFAGWKYNGTTYTTAQVKSHTISANRTYTAQYTINAPTTTLASTATHTAGSSTGTTITSSASFSGSGATVTKHFSVTGYPGTDTGSNNDAAVTDAGVFTASTPGVYTVSYYASASNTNANVVSPQSADSDTKTCTVTVYPVAPTFDITLSAYDSGTGTQADRWQILLGRTYHFTGSVNNSSLKSGYTYEWSKDGTTWDNLSGQTGAYSGATVSSSGGATDNIITFATQTADTESVSTLEFTLYLRVTKNGVSKEAAAPVTKYYFIQPLIKSFSFIPAQKIYNALYSAQIRAEYNLTNATGYTTTMYFSKDNNDYLAIQRKTNEFIGSFENTLKNFFYPDGVKNFKMEINKGALKSTSDVLHTTVGTKENTASRTVYFINAVSGLDLSNKRVMAYWPDPANERGYSFQTAQDIYKGVSGKTAGLRYRVTVPADAEFVVFAVADPKYYGEPTFANNSFTFTNPPSAETPGTDAQFFLGHTNNIVFGENNLYTIDGSTGSGVVVYTASQDAGLSNYVAE